MIQFFVNNTEIVLPDDFTITNIDENPLITRNGEYTLDIEVSLLVPENARAFNHVYRRNKSTVDKEGDCRQIINGIVKLGKWVYISNTDKTVKFQFVCGNSEVTYVTGEDKKIWELDFGTESAIDYARALSSATYPSYLNKFVCVPVKFSNLIANDYTVEDLSHYRGGIITGVNNIVMHPYLLYYVNKLPELLGFTLTSNILNIDERAKAEFIVNRTQSLKYSDALPDITIAEFISAIEYSFNVVFNFRKDSKNLEIVNAEDFYHSREIVSLEDTLDQYSRESDGEVYRFDFTKVSYELNKSGIFKFLKLDEEIRNLCTTVEYSNITYLKNSLVDADKNKYIIYSTTNNRREYIFCDQPELSVPCISVPATSGYLVFINKLKSFSINDSKELFLKIKPLEYAILEKEFPFTEGQGADYIAKKLYQLPTIASSLYTSTSQTIIKAIENNLETIPRGTSIEVGLYSGLMPFVDPNLPNPGGYNVTCQFPISYIDKLPEFGYTGSGFDLWTINIYSAVATQTLRITGTDGIYNRYFVDNTKFDTDYIYVFESKDSPVLKSENVFEFENNRYIPIRFERTLSNKETLVKGYFYRVK